MKKFLLVLVAGLLSQAAFAAVASISSSATPTATTVQASVCTYLKEDIKVLLSADVAAAYDCGSSSVGLATKADKGKGVTWSVGSDGGAIAKDTAGTAVGTAATAKKGS